MKGLIKKALGLVGLAATTNRADDAKAINRHYIEDLPEPIIKEHRSRRFHARNKPKKVSQKSKRKSARRAWAMGDKKAFSR